MQTSDGKLIRTLKIKFPKGFDVPQQESKWDLVNKCFILPDAEANSLAHGSKPTAEQPARALPRVFNNVVFDSLDNEHDDLMDFYSDDDYFSADEEARFYDPLDQPQIVGQTKSVFMELNSDLPLNLSPPDNYYETCYPQFSDDDITLATELENEEEEFYPQDYNENAFFVENDVEMVDAPSPISPSAPGHTPQAVSPQKYIDLPGTQTEKSEKSEIKATPSGEFGYISPNICLADVTNGRTNVLDVHSKDNKQENDDMVNVYAQENLKIYPSPLAAAAPAAAAPSPSVASPSTKTTIARSEVKKSVIPRSSRAYGIDLDSTFFSSDDEEERNDFEETLNQNNAQEEEVEDILATNPAAADFEETLNNNDAQEEEVEDILAAAATALAADPAGVALVKSKATKKRTRDLNKEECSITAAAPKRLCCRDAEYEFSVPAVATPATSDIIAEMEIEDGEEVAMVVDSFEVAPSPVAPVIRRVTRSQSGAKRVQAVAATTTAAKSTAAKKTAKKPAAKKTATKTAAKTAWSGRLRTRKPAVSKA